MDSIRNPATTFQIWNSYASTPKTLSSRRARFKNTETPEHLLYDQLLIINSVPYCPVVPAVHGSYFVLQIFYVLTLQKLDNSYDGPNIIVLIVDVSCSRLIGLFVRYCRIIAVVSRVHTRP